MSTHGTTVEGAWNWNGHNYTWDEDSRCMFCDCRPSGTAAQWPCGVDVPRMTLPNGFNVPMTPGEWADHVRNRDPELAVGF